MAHFYPSVCHAPSLPDGATVAELEADFHAGVDHYLEDCAKTGRNPQKPASGKLMLQIRPKVHAAVAIAAAASGKSINPWADEALDRAAQGRWMESCRESTHAGSARSPSVAAARSTRRADSEFPGPFAFFNMGQSSLSSHRTAHPL
ncbi:MAG: toxin-antitoxin system HicB family antitoxin [Janthinobacterium lividum]